RVEAHTSAASLFSETALGILTADSRPGSPLISAQYRIGPCRGAVQGVKSSQIMRMVEATQGVAHVGEGYERLSEGAGPEQYGTNGWVAWRLGQAPGDAPQHCPGRSIGRGQDHA